MTMKTYILNFNGIVRHISTLGMNVDAVSVPSSLTPVPSLTSNKDTQMFDVDKVKIILERYISDRELQEFKDLIDSDVGFDDKMSLVVGYLERILAEIKSINELGFINDFILKDSQKFPLSTKSLSLMLRGVKGKNRRVKLSALRNNDKLDLVKWWFNLVNLDVYHVLIILINVLKYRKTIEGLSESRELSGESDRLLDLINLSKEIRNGFDSYIKLGLKRGGITIYKNIYTGYDSEYKQVEIAKNQLLSVQLAVSSRIVLKMPNPVKFYTNQGVNSFSGAIYELSTVSGYLEMGYILGEVNNHIKELRSVLYPGYDTALSKVVLGLTNSGIKHVVKGEFIYFMFDKSVMRTWFKGDISSDGVSLVDLVRKSSEMVDGDLNSSLDSVFSLLINLYKAIDPENKVENSADFGKDLVKDLAVDTDTDTDTDADTNPDSDTKNDIESDTILVNEVEKGIAEEVQVKTDETDESDDGRCDTVDNDNNYNDNNNNNNDDVSETNFNVDGKRDTTVLESPENVIELSDLKVVSGNIYQSGKKYARTYRQTFTSNKSSVTIVTNNYFAAHLSATDLCLLNDFDSFKHELDIVNKSMVTLKKSILINGVNVLLRDTLLLAPGGSKLSAIGSLYGLNKVHIGNRIDNMDEFLRDDYELFKEYAVQDSKITLVHILNMEEFGFDLGLIGVPVSLSMLSSVYLRKEWEKKHYKGYQLNPEYLISDSKSQTPKGLFAVGDIGLRIGYYIANYKGGRNESFMYGIDDNLRWFDYDLIGAYPTAMSLMGHPDYKSAHILSLKDLLKMYDDDPNELIFSYTIIKGTFSFPTDTKYPSIPCYMDETSTIYPLKGDCILTGAEYYLAKKQGCFITVKEAYYIPFYRVEEEEKGKGKGKKLLSSNELLNPPFFDVVKGLVAKRSQYSKGTLENLLYKQIANSIYGLVAKGISTKNKFDARLGRTVRLEGNDLSNPIIASWITSFVRSVIGELLHAVGKANKKVVSVTTDGFLTDLENLEDYMIKYKSNTLFLSYKAARLGLTGDSTALEIKKSGVGMISWTTRGQFSFDGSLIASTGFQKGMYSMEDIDKLLRNGFASVDKEIIYLNRRLRSALDVFKFGGHVTSEFKDQTFRLVYDNRRKIIVPNNVTITKNETGSNGSNESNVTESKESIETVTESEVKVDKNVIKVSQNVLFDSNPVRDIEEARLFRYLSKKPYVKKYQRQLNVKTFRNKYKNVLEIAVRNFIRCLLTNSLNLNSEAFETYSDLAKFVNDYDTSLNVSSNVISQLKRRSAKPKKLYRDSITDAFVEYVKLKFPNFDAEKFFDDFKDSKDTKKLTN